MPKREGEPGTWSHCGRSMPHQPHTHSFAMNEGRYDNIVCFGSQPTTETLPETVKRLADDFESGKVVTIGRDVVSEAVRRELARRRMPEDANAALKRLATHPFFAESFNGHDKLIDVMIAKLDEAHKYLSDLDAVDQLYPTPEENFWDDRTTPLAYSKQDSERDMKANQEALDHLLD